MTATKIGSADGSGAMFDAIAHRYDLLNRILSAGIDVRWRAKLVSSLGLENGGTLLDLASGTGDVALEAAKHFPQATVIGTDPSANMLERAVDKSGAQGVSNRVNFELGSAERIELEDNAVDAVSMAFGIRNASDRPLALREMNRVTRAGGRIAILELSEPRGGLVSRLAGFHVHQLVPRIGALLSGRDEYRYLQASIAAFPPAPEFVRLMEEAGIRAVQAAPLTFGVAHIYLGVAA